MTVEPPQGDSVAPSRGWLWGAYSALGGIVALVALVVDQAHKWWMLKVWGAKEGVRTVINPFLDIVYVRNTGISYSLFDQKTMVGQYVLAGFAVLASVALWVWLARDGASRLMATSLGLIIGGALANAIDRVTLGGVADFFSLHAFGFYWYIFNIADVAIVAGVLGLLYDSYVASRKGAANVP